MYVKCFHQRTENTWATRTSDRLFDSFLTLHLYMRPLRLLCTGLLDLGKVLHLVGFTVGIVPYQTTEVVISTTSLKIVIDVVYDRKVLIGIDLFR